MYGKDTNRGSHFPVKNEIFFLEYSKTCLKRPLKKETKIGLQYRLSLYTGQKYNRMLQESIMLNGIYFVIYGIISEFTDKGQFQYLTN